MQNMANRQVGCGAGLNGTFNHRALFRTAHRDHNGPRIQQRSRRHGHARMVVSGYGLQRRILHLATGKQRGDMPIFAHTQQHAAQRPQGINTGTGFSQPLFGRGMFSFQADKVDAAHLRMNQTFVAVGVRGVDPALIGQGYGDAGPVHPHLGQDGQHGRGGAATGNGQAGAAICSDVGAQDIGNFTGGGIRPAVQGIKVSVFQGWLASMNFLQCNG